MTKESEGDFSAPHCHVICCTGPSAKVHQREGDEPLRKEHSSHHRTLGVRFLGPIVYPVGGSRYHLPILNEGAGGGYRGHGGVSVGVRGEGSDSPQGAGSCCSPYSWSSGGKRGKGGEGGNGGRLRAASGSASRSLRACGGHHRHRPDVDDIDDCGGDSCSNCVKLERNRLASPNNVGRQGEGKETTNSPRRVNWEGEIAAEKQDTSEDETAAAPALETKQEGTGTSASVDGVYVNVDAMDDMNAAADPSSHTAEATRTETKQGNPDIVLTVGRAENATTDIEASSANSDSVHDLFGSGTVNLNSERITKEV